MSPHRYRRYSPTDARALQLVLFSFTRTTTSVVLEVIPCAVGEDEVWCSQAPDVLGSGDFSLGCLEIRVPVSL